MFWNSHSQNHKFDKNFKNVNPPTLDFVSVPLYQEMLNQPHLLIAGATGSGKSVVINGLILQALTSPDNYELILIDLKKVELISYKDLYATRSYSDTSDHAVSALKHTLEIIDNRYQAMQSRHIRKSLESPILVIIDEFADLMCTCGKEVKPLIQRIGQIGRAANVHMIIATQCPVREVIPTPIKVNFDARLGLRTRSAQDSRNIIGTAGCEQLPRARFGYFLTPEGKWKVEIPYFSDAEIEEVVRWKKWSEAHPNCRF